MQQSDMQTSRCLLARGPGRSLRQPAASMGCIKVGSSLGRPAKLIPSRGPPLC
jgi:hypothetical protein